MLASLAFIGLACNLAFWRYTATELQGMDGNTSANAFLQLRQRVLLSDADLAAALDVPAERIADWAKGRQSVPGWVSAFLEASSTATRHEELLTNAGLPPCEWIVAQLTV